MNKPQGIVITRTPFRISFFGGGSDLPHFFNQHRGAVIGAAIDKYVYVTLNSLDRFFEKRIRLSYSKLENVSEPEELEHSIVRSILQSHPCIDKDSFLDIHTFADLPASSGVGSSSSFTVGMLNALYALHGAYRTPEFLAKEAIQIEREKLQQAGGWQDQVFAAFGGFNKIVFANNNFTVEPICLSMEKKQAIEAACMMFFIGGLRSSAEVQQRAFGTPAKEQNKRLETLCQQVEEAFHILASTSYRTDEMIHHLGKLLHQAWEIKRSLSSHISNSHIDVLYNKALEAGALGGKLCGAGGGGFLLMIAPPEKRANIAHALADYKLLDIRFQEEGSKVIYSKSCDQQPFIPPILSPVLTRGAVA